MTKIKTIFLEIETSNPFDEGFVEIPISPEINKTIQKKLLQKPPEVKMRLVEKIKKKT